MAERDPRRRTRPLSADEKRMRQWRSCGIVTLLGVVLLAGLYFGRWLFLGDHPHKPAPHGGVVVSVEDMDKHHHVEAVVEKDGTLKLYTFGEDVDQIEGVISQVLPARVQRAGDGEFAAVELMPAPQPADSEGRSSQFFGKLPGPLRGSPLLVRIASIEIDGKLFPLEFKVAASPDGGEADGLAPEEQKLYLTAGGKYTEADIRANGQQTALAKYQGFRAEHDLSPKRGDRVCPITRIKTNREFTWVVSGQTYEFCCPPCIDEFVRQAKEQPQTIREAQAYVKH